MSTNLTALFGGSSGRWNSQTFTTSGVWIKPAGVKVAKVLLVGGGGGGFNNPSTYISGGNGGNSIFYSTMPVIARGGQGGSIYHGGNGGGSTFTRIQPWYYIQGSTQTYWGSYPMNETLFGNGGYTSGTFTEYTKQGLPFMWGGTGEAGGFGSVSGGGGAAIYPFRVDSIWPGEIVMHGGSVPGFGERGTTPSGARGASGGASFGDGCSVGNINSGGYGGGGFATFRNLAGACGGGGGEITIREVPVDDKDAFVVVIGAGGFVSTTSPGSASSGREGLCIVYWQE